jgi:hypothetical protein
MLATHRGHTIQAGQSWLLIQREEGEAFQLAYVQPLTGIYTVDSGYFFHLTLYEDVW